MKSQGGSHARNDRRCEMSIVTMSMCDGNIETDNSMLYGDEEMCSGWNPALALQLYQTHSEATRAPPITANMATLEVEAFLNRMYACQR